MNDNAHHNSYACYILLLTTPSGKRFLQVGASKSPLEEIKATKKLGYQVMTLSLSEARMNRSEARLKQRRAWLILDHWQYQPEQLLKTDARWFQANAQTGFLLQREGILKPATAQVIACGDAAHKQTHLEDIFVPSQIQLRPSSWWQNLTSPQRAQTGAMAG